MKGMGPNNPGRQESLSEGDGSGGEPHYGGKCEIQENRKSLGAANTKSTVICWSPLVHMQGL